MSNLLLRPPTSPNTNSGFPSTNKYKLNSRLKNKDTNRQGYKSVKLNGYEECITYSLPTDLYDYDYQLDTRHSNFEYDSNINTGTTLKPISTDSIPMHTNKLVKGCLSLEDSRVLLTNSEPSSLRSSPICPIFKPNTTTVDAACTKLNVETESLKLLDAVAPLQSWIHCFLEVRFDLELGQAVDRLYPNFTDLSQEQLKTIAFSAFPDTRVFETGDMMFQFRLRKSKTNSSPTLSSLCKESESIDRPVQLDSEFYTAYVYFRQRKDSRVHRGYYQRSLVLLTSLPPSSTVGIFNHLITACGTKYHDFCFEPCPKTQNSSTISTSTQVFLETVLQDLARWPYPKYGNTLEVPLLGNVLKVEMPEHEFHPTLQLLETARLTSDVTETHLLASVPDNHASGLLLHWWDRLDDLWLLWELVLLGEPIVVLASDPATSSNVVLELLDLIKPIPYCGDFRPYLTVQDPDLKRFVNKTNVPNNTIVGVTNPYFLEGFKHWPHRIQVGNRFQQQPQPTNSISRANNGLSSKSKPDLLSNSFFGSLTFKTGSSSNLNGLQSTNSSAKSSQRTRNFNCNFNHDRRTVTTNYKSCITKDRNLIHSLTSAMLQGDNTSTLLNNRLRRYFGELTERFLAPLNRYMTTLMPNQISNPIQGNGQLDLQRLQPFRTQDFLKSLNTYGVTSQSPHAEWDQELYKRFLKCNNFATWLMMRSQRCDLELKRLRLERLCKFDLDKWGKFKRHETEIIDLIIKLRAELDIVNANVVATTSMARSSSASLTHQQRLTNQIDKAMLLLPKDLQAILKLK